MMNSKKMSRQKLKMLYAGQLNGFSSAGLSKNGNLALIVSENAEISVNADGKYFTVQQNRAVLVPVLSSLVCRKSEREDDSPLLIAFSVGADQLAEIKSVTKNVSAVANIRRLCASVIFSVETFSLAHPATVLLGRALVSLFCAEQERENEFAGFYGIKDFLDEGFLLPDIIAKTAEEMKMSVSAMVYSFSRETGITPKAYVMNKKLSYAKELLRSGLYSVAETADKCGYSDTPYFCRVFKKNQGMTAHAYAKKYKERKV